MVAPVLPRDLYEYNPDLTHEPGDIWTDVPTLGLLRSPVTAGIVITPACDLSWSKSETLTFLPIIPVYEYFRLQCATRIVLQEVSERLKCVDGLGDDLSGLPSSAVLSTDLLHTLSIKCGEIESRLSTTNKANEKKQLHRAIAGLQFLLNGDSQSVAESSTWFSTEQCDKSRLADLFGNKWAPICHQLVSNNYGQQVHFLPSDGQPKEWAGIPEHSLALFRYPISWPIELFNLAQDLSILEWPSALQKAAGNCPAADLLKSRRPMKALRLKRAFTTDLLSRYVSLYVRVGSPDFDGRSKRQLIKEVAGDDLQ
ncbi:MAG: hypothetical protein KJZ84_04645 [Bryobacteraceae bacterium]|nr:hypothetical protein [Bryobacteraceae bacterium]